jgi:hypothetical protein
MITGTNLSHVSTWGLLAFLGVFVLVPVLGPIGVLAYDLILPTAVRRPFQDDLQRIRSTQQYGGFVLAIVSRLLPPSERARYFEEFLAELLDLPRTKRLRHALSLLRGVLVLRLRRGLKDKATDAAARRAKG